MRNFLVLAWLIFTAGCSTLTHEPKPFSFAVIADIQWADRDSSGNRHFRESLGKLTECVNELNRKDLAFTIQLGDLINGQASKEQTLSDLDRAVKEYNRLAMPKYHVIGNHCLAAGKEALHEKLKLPCFYYDFTVPAAKGWRFIVLDGNDAGYGVLGREQLKWLESSLVQARQAREKVIIFSHFAVLEAAAKHRMQNPEPMLKLITESGCVAAFFAGHDHAGGYAYKDGIRHVTIKGMVEQPPETAYAVVEVTPSMLRVTGFGREPSRELKLEQRKATDPVLAAKSGEAILTAASFIRIRDFVLEHGDRQTYCNMYNHNPHASFNNIDIYLNPDTGQQNINCDPKLSGFNNMVVRTREPWIYYRLSLNMKDTGPDLEITKDTDQDNLRRIFQSVLSELDKAK